MQQWYSGTLSRLSLCHEEAHCSAAAWPTPQWACTSKSCRPVCSPTYIALTARARSVSIESRWT
eukprot:scaffold40909_cov73-Phaeocystis_antarctica.AAC.10